jgi:hypothetical protein
MATCFTTRIGMGRWFAVTVGLWGATTAATAAVRGPGELIALRVLLGLFEAGTLPGCYCLLSRFHTVRMGVVGRVEGGERQKRVPPPPLAPDPPPTPPRRRSPPRWRSSTRPCSCSPCSPASSVAPWARG